MCPTSRNSVVEEVEKEYGTDFQVIAENVPNDGANNNVVSNLDLDPTQAVGSILWNPIIFHIRAPKVVNLDITLRLLLFMPNEQTREFTKYLHQQMEQRLLELLIEFRTKWRANRLVLNSRSPSDQ